jgi:hypothetical protein
VEGNAVTFDRLRQRDLLLAADTNYLVDRSSRVGGVSIPRDSV